MEYEQGQIAKREAAAAAASSGKYGSNAGNGDDDCNDAPPRDQGAFAAEDDFPQMAPKRYVRPCLSHCLIPVAGLERGTDSSKP